jgi:hypothetical protein
LNSPAELGFDQHFTKQNRNTTILFTFGEFGASQLRVDVDFPA